jgi:TolB-like protein
MMRTPARWFGIASLAGSLTLVAANVGAAQDNHPVVAVLAFDNNSIGRDGRDFDGVGKGIADLLITDMASNSAIRLVDRDRIQMVLQEQTLARSGSIDPETSIRVGRLLGAQYAVMGGFMSDGRGTVVLTARAVDVETGEISNPQRVQAKSDDVLGLIAQLSARLNADIKLESKFARRLGEVPAEARNVSASRATPPDTRAKPMHAETFARPIAVPSQPVKLDLAAARLYSHALDEMDRKNSAAAAKLLRQVIDKFPDFVPARDNLAKLSKSNN